MRMSFILFIRLIDKQSEMHMIIFSHQFYLTLILVDYSFDIMLLAIHLIIHLIHQYIFSREKAIQYYLSRMKTQENLPQLMEVQLEGIKNPSSKAHNIFSEKILECKGKNPAYEYCLEQQCHKSAVICYSQSCECQSQHQNCQTFFRVNKFHANVNDKIIHNTEAIIAEIDEEVKKISDRACLMIEDYTEMFKTFGLNKNDENIIDQILNHGNHKKIGIHQAFLSGNTFFKHRESYKQANKDWFDFSLQKYKSVCQQAQSQIVPMFEAISNIITFVHIKHRQNSEIHNYFYESKFFEKSQNKLFGGSIQSPTKFLLDTLQKNMKIESFKKIYTYEYKKTEHFSKNSLLKGIENKENLLFLVKNTEHNRFGAFITGKMQKKHSPNFNVLNDEINLSIGFSLNVQHSEKNSKSRNGLHYNQKNNTLQIGEGIASPDSQMNTIFKFLITFEQNGMNAELFFRQKVHPTKKNYNGCSYSMTYDQIHGRSKSSYPSGIPVSVLEVYQVVLKEIIPKHEIKEIMGVKINMGELKAKLEKAQIQILPGKPTQKNEGLFAKQMPQASSLFKTIKPQHSIFGNNN